MDNVSGLDMSLRGTTARTDGDKRGRGCEERRVRVCDPRY